MVQDERGRCQEAQHGNGRMSETDNREMTVNKKTEVEGKKEGREGRCDIIAKRSVLWSEDVVFVAESVHVPKAL